MKQCFKIYTSNILFLCAGNWTAILRTISTPVGQPLSFFWSSFIKISILSFVKFNGTLRLQYLFNPLLI